MQIATTINVARRTWFFGGEILFGGDSGVATSMVADSEAFSKALSVGQLPKDRAEGCDDEYEHLQRAFSKLIVPHIDLVRWRRVIAEMRFN